MSVESGDESSLVFLCELVFPNSQHAPTFLPERFRDESIAHLIARNFLEPELRVALRLYAMLGTAVPEASVDEYDQLLHGKREVWLPE